MDWLKGNKQGEVRKLISQLSDPSKREAASQDLIALGGESVPALVAALQTSDLGQLRIYQQILAHIPTATAVLTHALGTAHPLVRGRVVEVLGISKDKTALPALLDALKGEFFTVRSRAALVLANFGDPHVIPELLPLLKDKEDEVRMAACSALGAFREPSTFEEIGNVLLDDHKIEVRQAAARALGETRRSEAAIYLMEALHDSSWWYEREQAANDLMQAIENMGSAVVEPLIKALGDREGTVRKLAATMLGDLGDARAVEELGMTLYDLHHEVGEAAARSLVRFGTQAVEVLLEALGHPEAGIRKNAVQALGQIQDARIVPVLIGMLQDPERIVRSQVVQSLGKLKDPSALPALEQIAADRGDRELAALAKQSLDLIR